MTSRNLQSVAMGAVIPVVSPHISQNSQAPTLPLQSSSKQFATTEFIDTLFADTSTIATGTSIQSYQQTAPVGFLANRYIDLLALFLIMCIY